MDSGGPDSLYSPNDFTAETVLTQKNLELSCQPVYSWQTCWRRLHGKRLFVTNCLVECNYSEWNPARAIAVNISTLAESFQGAVMTLSGQDLCFISQWKACKSTAKNHQPREITFLAWICKLNIWAEKEGTGNGMLGLLEERGNPESQCLLNESVYCVMSKWS